MEFRSANFYYPFTQKYVDAYVIYERSIPYLIFFSPDKTTGQVFTAPDPSQHQNGSTITWQTIEKIWNQGNLV